MLCACSRLFLGELEPGVLASAPLRAGTALRFGILLTATVFSLAESFQTIHLSGYFLDRYKDEAGQVIKQHTTRGDKLIVWGAFWGEPFLRAEREGFTAGNLSILADPKQLGRLKELGYTKLVLMNPSPYLVALTTVTGTRVKTAVDLPEQMPAAAKNWPVVLSSPSILILDIPK